MTPIASTPAAIPGGAEAQPPPLATQPDALDACDRDRPMARHPEEVAFILPGGHRVEGRRAIGDRFEGSGEPRAEGRLRRAVLQPGEVGTTGGAMSMSRRVAAARPAEPRRGTDAPVPRGEPMRAQVTAFDPADTELAEREVAAATPLPAGDGGAPRAPAPGPGADPGPGRRPRGGPARCPA